MPRDPTDEVQLQIRMTRALRDRLKMRAVKNDTDMSALARRLIVQGLRAIDRKPLSGTEHGRQRRVAEAAQ